jgi:bis(5'-nucleosyl)-tetraphosphatase (symmetrical)
MATWAIGDLQGCHEEFLALLDLIRFDPATDRLWLTGDLVNRGPASLEVLRTVRALGPAATVVLGNHDLHLLAVAAGGGRGLRPADTLDAILAAPDRDELLAWLAARPLFHRDRALGWTLIHAGLPPQWDLDTAEACARELERALVTDARGLFRHMYGDQPDLWSPRLDGYDRLRYIVNCLTRLRVVDAAGRVLIRFKGPLAEMPAGAMPWFRHPGRLSAGERIIAGHWSAIGYVDEAGVKSLDSGCVWGGSLCALRLDADEPPRFLQCRGTLRPGED